ncbi:helix-turn-helix transcriptional regulator [Rhodococcus sp. T2V]|uniref:helix-turn-helix domain-containing protein n=1 Tax=Rhodococcus sp. T2V TaxID=3034164 RepID=UPI0023E0C012|nr:helix-turn-helix transcriptional regulator [Rhodococcus sp. T2V]MDF3309893.1 helix-turn-helix transcriptional regulator [Rhodococcus sp. T2V]
MAEKKNPLGPIGEIAAGNVKRLREHHRLSYAELSRRLADLGRPIAPLGLSRIESGERRIDTDDLVALAISFRVSPLALILPRESSTLTPAGEVYDQQEIWEWGQGTDSLEPDRDDPAAQLAFMRESNPLLYAKVIETKALNDRNLPKLVDDGDD